MPVEEIGIIKGVNHKQDMRKKNKLRYEVELGSGRVVLVNETLIEPVPENLLENGVRLKVKLNGSHVLQAALYQSSPSAPTVSSVKVVEYNQRKGTIKVQDAAKQALTLRISPDSNFWRVVEQDVSLQLTTSIDENGKTLYSLNTLSSSVSPGEPEPIKLPAGVFTAQVNKFDQQKGVLTIDGPNGQPFTLRLSTSHKIWGSLQIGNQLQVTPGTNAEGKAIYTIQLLEDKSSEFENELQPVQSQEEETPLSEQIPTAPVPVPLKVGKISQILTYYMVIDLDEGGQVNGLIAQWPRKSPLPYVGMEVKCRCIPGRHEVVEFIGVAESSDEPKVDAAVAGRSFGFDSAYFAERQREGHRYEIMTFLKEHGEQGHIEWYEMKPSVPPRYAKPITPLPSKVDKAIRDAETEFKEFFLHQAKALDSIRAGHNLILVTPTASGKTLSYNPAIFETLYSLESQTHVLYIFPLNALLMDQKEKIDNLVQQLSRQGIEIKTEFLVGGVGYHQRLQIASANPHIICTNPEMLGTMLSDYKHDHWKEFFSGLRYVVIDEVHSYRGLLGRHTAGLLRRLLLVVRRLNTQPQFILCSATVHNPLDLASRLTSLPANSFDLLNEESDGSAQQAKHWVVYSPDISKTKGNYDSYLGAAASVMVELLCARDRMGKPSPLNSILFARSMRDVNKVYQIVKQNLQRQRPDLVNKVRSFISASLDIEEKQAIYEGLKNGRYVGVVSTNALEAGIDIGRLDACIIAGFPFTVMRMRQMAGRVGRKNEGLVVFVPHPAQAVDEYYRYNPDLLLTQQPEAFVLDAENPYIARKHLNAAAYELNGILENEIGIFGSRHQEILNMAINKEVMYRSRNGDRIFGKKRDYNDLQDLFAIHNIRSTPQMPFGICRNDNAECFNQLRCLNDQKKCKKCIAVIDRQYIYRDCHPGAVYEAPDGKFYRIHSLDEQQRIAFVCELPDITPERTRVIENTEIGIVEQSSSYSNLPNGAIMRWGRVRVARNFSGYQAYTLEPARRCRRCHLEFDETIDTCLQCGRSTEMFFRDSPHKYEDFPSPYHDKGFQITLETVGAWLTIPAQVENQLSDVSPCKLPGENNKLMQLLQEPFTLESLPQQLNLTGPEIALLSAYQRKVNQILKRRKEPRKDVIIFPGIYGQCLLKTLRLELPEERSLEIFEALTGYPVTSKLNHVCRKCQTSMLLPAMHALEHVVTMRYPSVALGDQSDVAAYTILGHETTGEPTVFWFDTYPTFRTLTNE